MIKVVNLRFMTSTTNSWNVECLRQLIRSQSRLQKFPSPPHLSKGALAKDLEEPELLEADSLAAALPVDQLLQGRLTWKRRGDFEFDAPIREPE